MGSVCDSCVSSNVPVSSRHVSEHKSSSVSSEQHAVPVNTKEEKGLEWPITNAVVEMGLAGSFGAAFIRLGPDLALYAVTILVFALYVVGVIYAGIGRALLRKYGVKRPACRTRSFGETSVFGLLAILCIFITTYASGRTPLINLHFFVCVPLYPIYGYCQHWFLQGMGTANLQVIHIPNCLIPLLMGIVFAAVHWFGGIYLSAATGLLGIVFSALFIRYRDLFPLGIWHGILGGVYYYVFEGSDQFNQGLARLNIDSPLG